MAKKASRRPAVRKTASKGTKKTSRPRKTAEEQAYMDSLMKQGQAARVSPGGKLPRGVTHELVEDGHGEVRAVRRRFSLL